MPQSGRAVPVAPWPCLGEAAEEIGRREEVIHKDEICRFGSRFSKAKTTLWVEFKEIGLTSMAGFFPAALAAPLSQPPRRPPRPCVHDFGGDAQRQGRRILLP
jgi:hypothetical protein